MAFSEGELVNLAKAHQRAECRFVPFGVKSAPTVAEITPGTYIFKDMINILPRYSWVANSGTVVLDGTKSQQRGSKAAVTGYSWSLSGSGSITDNADGTCDYTAPASGTGTAEITLTSDGNASPGGTAYVAYGDQSLNIGAVSSYTGSLSSGGWEMTVRAYGDCTGLERQKGVLLITDDYWDGSKSNFGVSRFPQGKFFGIIDRFRTIFQDADNAYLEVTIKSPQALFNYGRGPEVVFSNDSGDAEDAVIVADFQVVDAAWIILQESNVNSWCNVWFRNNTETVDNLKVSRGPLHDVIADIQGRMLGIVHCTRMGDYIITGDPDLFQYIKPQQEAWGNLAEALYESVSTTEQKFSNNTSPSDPAIGQVTFEGILPNLSEVSVNYPTPSPSPGNFTTVSGLIVDNTTALNAIAPDYYNNKLHRNQDTMVRLFMLHHCDLGDTWTLSLTYRAADVSNLDQSTETDAYIEALDYDIDPGTGTWVGGMRLLTRQTIE